MGNGAELKDLTTAVAMGGGEEAFYDKKLTKEEKKALAAKKREEKRKAKLKAAGKGGDEEDEQEEDVVQKALESAMKKGEGEEGVETNEAAEQLASEGTICTFSTSRKGVDARSRDVNVQNFTLQHKGNVMFDGTSIVLNHGNRYGLIGRNGELLLQIESIDCIRCVHQTCQPTPHQRLKDVSPQIKDVPSLTSLMLPYSRMW